MEQQRSNEWFDARLGRFTASKISLLLGVKGFLGRRQRDFPWLWLRFHKEMPGRKNFAPE